MLDKIKNDILKNKREIIEILSIIENASSPLRRTIPIPELVIAVEIAAIVSVLNPILLLPSILL